MLKVPKKFVSHRGVRSPSPQGGRRGHAAATTGIAPGGATLLLATERDASGFRNSKRLAPTLELLGERDDVFCLHMASCLISRLSLGCYPGVERHQVHLIARHLCPCAPKQRPLPPARAPALLVTLYLTVSALAPVNDISLPLLLLQWLIACSCSDLLPGLFPCPNLTPSWSISSLADSGSRSMRSCCISSPSTLAAASPSAADIDEQASFCAFSASASTLCDARVLLQLRSGRLLPGDDFSLRLHLSEGFLLGPSRL